MQDLRVFLHFLPPLFSFGHEDASRQKFFSRFFTAALSRLFVPALFAGLRNGEGGEAQQQQQRPHHYAGTCLTCGGTERVNA